MFVLFQFADVVSMNNFTKFAQTKFAKKLVGKVLSKPVFVPDIQKRSMEKLKNKDAGFNPITAFIDNFAWGDVFSLTGIGLLIGHHFLIPPDKNDSWLDKGFMWATGIVSAFGFGLARVGQIFNWHKQDAFGDEYWKFLIEEGQAKTGKNVFEEMDYDQVKRRAKKLEDTLIYPMSMAGEITGRHKNPKGLVGLICGSFGTGKTEGVNLILGKWLEKVESEGKKGKIFKLNSGHLNEALEMVKNDQMVSTDDLSTFGLGAINLSEGNDTLKSFQYLIKRCREEIASAKKGGYELAIFVDEFEKVILDPKVLKSCDKSQLKNVLIEFCKLLEGDFQNLIVTSNKTRKQLREELKDFVDEGTLLMMLSRLTEVEVPIPDADTQARIISNYIINDLVPSNQIQLSDFDFGGVNVSTIDDLKMVLLTHSQANGNYLANGILAGRELEKVTAGLPAHIDVLKKEGGDGKKITLDCIKAKICNMIESTAEIRPELKSIKDVKLKAISLVQTFIRSKQSDILDYYETHKRNKEDLKPLSVLRAIYKSLECSDSFYTDMSNNEKDHGIIIKDGKVTVAYHDSDKYEGNPFFGFYMADGIDQKEFENIISIELAKFLPKENTLFDVLRQAFNISINDETFNQLFPVILNALAT